jgi:hypothetical protein
MLRILVALAVAAAIFLVTTALSGTARYTKPAQVTTLSGPEKGVLRPVP